MQTYAPKIKYFPQPDIIKKCGKKSTFRLNLQIKFLS